MSNLYDFMGASPQFRKFKLDDLLFVEYTCDPGGPRADVWCHTNFITHVTSGQMTLKTPKKDYVIRKGGLYFVRKGGFIVPEFFEEVFCELIMFVPDDFIRGVVDKYEIHLPRGHLTEQPKAVITLDLDEILIDYYRSMFTYFKLRKPPTKALLRIKFEELLVHMLSNPAHGGLRQHIVQIHHSGKPPIREIMEANFNSHLTIGDYARLTARSLSSFRRDFRRIFGTPPGKWLKQRRLQYSRKLIETTDHPLEEVMFLAGFKNRSHFSRSFREKFGVTPSALRASRI